MKFLCVLVFLFFGFPAHSGVVSEKEFLLVIDETTEKLAPWVYENYGADFEAVGDWHAERLPTSGGASAPGFGRNWKAFIAGWLVRQAEFGPDEMRVTFCHELGHHVYSRGAEREADHFAAGECRIRLGVSKRRAIRAFKNINQFRKQIWQEFGLQKREISSRLRCRQKVFRDGLDLKPFRQCD